MCEGGEPVDPVHQTDDGYGEAPIRPAPSSLTHGAVSTSDTASQNPVRSGILIPEVIDVMKHVVVRIDGETVNGGFRVKPITPWNYNRALVELARDAHQELDPNRPYAVLSLPEKYARRPRQRRIAR